MGKSPKVGVRTIILLAGSLAAPVIAGLVVGAAFVSLFAVSGIVPTMCGAPGLQLSPPDLQRQIQYSDMIVYGTVLSAELQPVYYATPFGDIGTHLRYTVTIFADRYILDKTGEGAKIITFREDGFGCSYAFKSEVYADNPYAVEHKRGEQAIFFIYTLDTDHLGKVEGDWSSFALFNKYALVGKDGAGNNLIQSKWGAREGGKPMTIEALEMKVNGFIGDR